MSEPRSIPLADILSITTELLLSRRHMDGIYDLLGHMTGQDVFTHQIPTVTTSCAPELIRQHPFLADLKPPTGLDTPDLLAWLVEAERQHGEELVVAPLTEWTYRDPIEDACDAVGAERVFVVPVQDGR